LENFSRTAALQDGNGAPTRCHPSNAGEAVVPDFYERRGAVIGKSDGSLTVSSAVAPNTNRRDRHQARRARTNVAPQLEMATRQVQALSVAGAIGLPPISATGSTPNLRACTGRIRLRPAPPPPGRANRPRGSCHAAWFAFHCDHAGYTRRTGSPQCRTKLSDA